MDFEANMASQFDIFGRRDADSAAGANGASRWGHTSLSLCPDTDVTRQEARAVVAVIDDDERVRQSTIWLLEGAGYQVLSYVSGDAFLAAEMPDRLDVALLDMHMPGRNGLDVLRVLAAREDAPSVLVLTGHGDIAMAVEAMKLKAADFLQKPYPPLALLEALEDALAEREQIRAVRTPNGRARALVNALPPRQRQVLTGIVRGLANKTIAWQLGLSVRTVEDYRAQLIERLGVRCTAEAIRIGLDAGIGTGDGGLESAA